MGSSSVPGVRLGTGGQRATHVPTPGACLLAGEADILQMIFKLSNYTSASKIEPGTVARFGDGSDVPDDAVGYTGT